MSKIAHGRSTDAAATRRGAPRSIVPDADRGADGADRSAWRDARRPPRRAAPRAVRGGERLVEAGDQVVPFFVVVEGAIEIVQMLDEAETIVAVHGPGQFSGEVNMISGRRALFAARAREDGRIIVLDREQVVKL